MANDRGKGGKRGTSKAAKPGRKGRAGRSRKTSFTDVYAVLDNLETDLRADRSHPKAEHLIQIVGAFKELSRVMCLAFAMRSEVLEFGPGGLFKD